MVFCAFRGFAVECASMETLRDLLRAKMPALALDGFLALYEKSRRGPAVISNWPSILGPHPDKLPHYDSLPAPDRAQVQRALGKLVVCKLNGGLGTSMGCSGPKSAVVVRDGLSFLDLIVEQICQLNGEHGTHVPLVLMNSFYTHAATDIGKYRGRLDIETFRQNRFPRLEKGSALPLDEKRFGDAAWYPPGHGDFYACVHQQGLLDRWLDRGLKILFISNADNLGATVDERILSYMADGDCPFLMEVTQKTAADVKGGALYQANGRLHLLEVAQVPPEHRDDFGGTQKFRTFNTNNLWINLVRLRESLERGPMDLPVIVNPKTVQETEVIQLETAMGAAIGNFPGSLGLNVPRSRHLPVKKTDDLLLVQSDLFILHRGSLSRNPARRLAGLPQIAFGPPFTRLDEYQKRIPSPPSLVELESLALEGDVRFEEGVALKGRVTIAGRGKPLTIPRNAVLEDEEMAS